jgi:hypothetical protein
MIESITKQLNIMIKKQLLFILAVTTFGYVIQLILKSINGFMQGIKEEKKFLSYSSENTTKYYCSTRNRWCSSFQRSTNK